MKRRVFKLLSVLPIGVILSVQVNAQVTFGSLLAGDAIGGTSNHSTLAPGVSNPTYKVMNTLKGSSADFIKFYEKPSFVVSDKDGNLLMGYRNGRALTRIGKTGNKAIVFYNRNQVQSVALDKNAQYAYISSTTEITRSVWKDDGEVSSIGYYASQPVGVSTNDITSHSLIRNNDMVFRNQLFGVANLNEYSDFGSISGMVLDSEGNLFYGDATNHVVRKIGILNKKLDGYAAAGSSEITLESTDGIMNLQKVSGPNLPVDAYVGSINGKVVTLKNSTGDPAVIGGSGILSGSEISFVTSIDDVLGTFGIAASGNALGNTAGESAINFVDLGGNLAGISMAFDKNGNLYVPDKTNQRVLKIAAVTGKVTKNSPISVVVTGLPAAGSNGYGITIDDNGFLYVACTNDNRIFKFNLASNLPIATVTGTHVLVGSGGRYAATMSVTSGSNEATSAAALTVSAAPIGSIIRSSAHPQGTRVTSIFNDNKSISLDYNATASTSPLIIFTSPDGLATTAMGTSNTGRVDGPFGLTIVKNGNSLDLVYTETLGQNIRVLKGIGTLPVTLLRPFTAKLSYSNVVDLNWATAEEKNNNHFIIKKSTNGVNFAELSKIPSKSSAGSDYYSTDFAPSNGVNYYELSQVDNDGKTEILGLRTVKVGLAIPEIKIIPNPVTNSFFSLQLASEISKNNTVNIKIVDMVGRSVYDKSFTKSSNGIYAIALISSVNKGIYVISVNGQNSQKLIVE